MVFLTDSEVSDQYGSRKKDTYHGTFGLGCLTHTAHCVPEVVLFDIFLHHGKMSIAYNCLETSAYENPNILCNNP